MAFCAYWGKMSPAEFAEADAHETRRFALQLQRLQEQERELTITLAKLTAGARLTAREEVRG